MSTSVRVEWVKGSASGHVVLMFDLWYGSFMITGFKLMKSTVSDTLWVGMPSKQVGPANNRRWVTTVSMPDGKKKKVFEQWVLGEYNKYKEVHGG